MRFKVGDIIIRKARWDKTYIITNSSAILKVVKIISGYWLKAIVVEVRPGHRHADDAFTAMDNKTEYTLSKEQVELYEDANNGVLFSPNGERILPFEEGLDLSKI